MKSDPPDAARQELAALAAMPESAIDFSDLPPLKVDEWGGAVRGKLYHPVELERVAEAFVTNPSFAQCSADEALWGATATDGRDGVLDRA